jgi:sec-independent protein translocase protein TatA
MVFGVGPNELLVILIIAVILFGPKKLPELAKSLGRAVAEFNKAKEEFSQESIKRIVEEEMALERPLSKDIVKIAENMGIEVEGKTDSELLKEIAEKTAQKEKEEKKEQEPLPST